MNKTLSYKLSLVFSALVPITMIILLFVGLVATGFFGIPFVDTSGVPKIIVFPVVIAEILLAIACHYVNIWRRKSRVAAKYDEYGRMKNMNSYENLSVKEQNELDRITMMENERILPSTQIKQMTRSGSKDPEADMKRLIGLDEVKEQLEEISARAEFSRTHKEAKMDAGMHMVLFGPPGTGKTSTVAIITGMFYKAGIIKRNFFIDCTGSMFTDADGPKKMEAVIQRSYGGCLFIDEAYALVYSQAGIDSIAALIKAMEDEKGHFILFLAGYEDEMKELLSANPGFLSRIQTGLYFHDYSDDELAEIFKQMTKAHGMKIRRSALTKFYECIEMARESRNFGNARTVRSILNQSMNRHALNLKKGLDKDDDVLEAVDIVYVPNRLAG